MAARRTQGPGKPVTGMVMLGAVVLAGYAISQGYPGIAAIWAGLVVSAWMYPPAVMTGKKDSRGYPTAGPGEQAAMNKYRFWSDLKFKLLLPSMDWLPGLKVQLSWLAAVWAGFAAYFIPVTEMKYTHGYGPWIDAAAAFIAVAQYTASRRRTEVADDENPGATIDVLINLAKNETPKVIGLTIGGFAVAAVLGTVATVLLPLATKAAHLPAIPEPVIWTIFLTGGPVALLSKPWITAALEHWRVVVAAREEWAPRWEMLKQDPAPRLVDRQEIGNAVVDTFDAPGSVGAMGFWAMGPKIGPTLGTGAKFAVLDTPNLDSNNQPMPGTRHPLRFDFVRWPSDQMPDVTDHDTPKEVVHQLARCALAWMSQADGSGRLVLDQVFPMTTPPAPAAADAAPEEGAEPAAPAGGAVWGMTWHAPEGPPANYVRTNGMGSLAGSFNAPVLVDHRANNDGGMVYFGDIYGATTWDPQAPAGEKDMERLASEDLWNGRWAEAVPAHSTNPPVPQMATASEARLKGGTVVNHLAFVTRQGMTPQDFYKFEYKLSTVLNAAPFVCMTGYPGPSGRPGDRHPQAFSLYWSHDPVPGKPDTLAPVPADRRAGIYTASEAPKWVLQGMLNQAFAAAKLPDRPQLVNATCLTKPESRQHIWKIEVRLYGGVTLAEVRGMAQKIRQHWGSEWLRVAPANEGCTIIVGAKPSKVKLADPRHERYLEALNWDQVFLDSGLSGIGGLMPTLAEVSHMPRNEQVSILEFDLTGTGLDYTSFTAVRNKLELNSGNTFVEPRKIKNVPNRIQLLTCEINPMPETAGYDWDFIKDTKFIPFATGVEGEPIEYNFRVDPHLLIAGASGGGKSVLMQSLMFGALMRGYDLYISDPTKAGADFKFAEPYAKAFTSTVFEAAAMMKGIYAEVMRRKSLVASAGVGNYRDLPDDVRPNHMVLVLDEFTSLMGQDPVPPASDDPEMDAEREMIIATNAARTQIGVYTGKVAREARFVGLTLFLATQKLSAKMLDTIPGAGDLKVNLSRLLMGKATYGDKQSALRAPQDAPDLGDAIPPGRGLFETTAGAAMAIQAWYDPAEQVVLAQQLAADGPAMLTAAEKLDLTPFMPKLPDMPGMEESAAKVVELDEIVLELGDLELDLELDDLEDLDSGETADGDWAIDDELADAALFFDVDGTILPFRHAPGMAPIHTPGHGAGAYHADLIHRLAGYRVRQAWLTARGEDAPEALGVLFPHATEVLDSDTEATGWWKIDAALAWCKANPAISRIVWADDELADEDFILGLPYKEIAADAFEAAGVQALLLAPDPDHGITAADLEEIDFFLGVDRAPGAPAPAAAAAPAEVPAPSAVPDLFSAEEWAAAAPAPAPAAAVPGWATAAPVGDDFGFAPAPGQVMTIPGDDPFAIPGDDPFAAPAPRFVPDGDPFA